MAVDTTLQQASQESTLFLSTIFLFSWNYYRCFPKLCVDHTLYALKFFLDVIFLNTSRFRTRGTHLGKGCELSAEWMSPLGISSRIMTPVGVFNVPHISLYVKHTRPVFEVFLCLIELPWEGGGSRSVLKARCTFCRPVSNGFSCAHIVSVATLYAEDVQRISQLKSVIGQHFSLKALFHLYWCVDCV